MENSGSNRELDASARAVAKGWREADLRREASARVDMLAQQLEGMQSRLERVIQLHLPAGPVSELLEGLGQEIGELGMRFHQAADRLQREANFMADRAMEEESNG